LVLSLDILWSSSACEALSLDVLQWWYSIWYCASRCHGSSGSLGSPEFWRLQGWLALASSSDVGERGHEPRVVGVLVYCSHSCNHAVPGESVLRGGGGSRFIGDGMHGGV
jgi:hypothetical protein